MMRNFVAYSLIVLVLFAFLSPMPVQAGNQNNDWNALNSKLNTEVAVKAQNVKTVFGILTDFSSDEIKIRVSQNSSVSEVVFEREQVEKVWSAELNKTSRRTLLGVGIGAAVGLATDLILVSSADPRDGAPIAIYTVVGALVGGTVGFFARYKKNKKKQLIYQK